MSYRNCAALCLLSAFTLAAAAESDHVYFAKDSLWKPVADEMYMQEIGEKVATEKPIEALTIFDGTLFALIDGTVHTLAYGRLEPIYEAPANVRVLKSLDGALWASTDTAVHRYDGSALDTVFNGPMLDFCMHLGQVHGATRDAIYRFERGRFVDIQPEGGYLSSDSTVVMANGTQVLADPVRIGPIAQIASYSGTLYMMHPHRLALIDRKVFVPNPIDWGMLPNDVLRDMTVLGSRLFVSTDRGVAVLRGMAMTTLTGDDGLPYEDTTCLAQGFDGDLWIGTTTGAIRKAGDDYHYFGADHWLPGNNVRDIAVGDNIVYIATDAGLGIIRYEPYTLQKKANYFERAMDDWGFKRLGFVHKLYWSNDEDEWLREISDNDGGHTAHYLAAMSYKFAATGDEQARAEALDAFKAMVWLEDITPKDGFFARAIWSVEGDKGQLARFGSGGLPAKWYDTDDGLWVWKGDTSSDEVNGHFYAVALFHDLVAQGAEKQRAAEHLARIATHIIENGWVLRDMDGGPTRWGQWSPEYLLTPYGYEARGLNGMEAQAYMIIAHTLTGDPKFQQGLQQLLDWGYHTYTVRQKQTFPPDHVVPWDDELAFRVLHPMLKYTNDAELRSIYLRSIERHWEVMRMQKLPYYNFIYGSRTGNDCEAEQAVQHLREWSLDPVNHNFRNSHRHDLAPEPGYVPYSGGTRAISPRESTAMWGSRSAIRYNGGSGSRGATPPVGWLEDYWMGRYYGFIEAPATEDPALTAAPPRAGRVDGAAPYDGPPRPEGLIPGQ
jgi:hypothetical protein